MKLSITKLFRLFAKLGLAAAAALLVTACGGGTPSKSDVEQIFRDKKGLLLKDGVIAIESFEQTDAFEGKGERGVKHYTVTYEAVIVWPKGLNPDCVPENLTGRCFKARENNRFREVGETVTERGSMKFTKNKEGWKGPDGEIY